MENRLKNKGVLKLTQKEKVDELYEIMKTKKKIISRHDKEILFSDKTMDGPLEQALTERTLGTSAEK
jgi:hypothetical protein